MTRLGFLGFVISSALTWAIACGGEAENEADTPNDVGDAGNAGSLEPAEGGSAGSPAKAEGGSAGVSEPGTQGGDLGAPTAAGSAGDLGAGGTTETFTCGDGVRNGNEECDEAKENGMPGSYCDEDCKYFPDQCGDGEQQPWELCDDGNDNDYDTCSNYCMLTTCGDGILQAGEECDDGNRNGGDACRPDCTLPTCGDGMVDRPEECDDGNRNPNDDCLNDCTAPTCGDGIIHNQGSGTESCDNGEDNGPFPATCGRKCHPGPHCGSGVVEEDGGKDCDDGENDEGEGLNTETSSCLPNCEWNSCGDGFAYIHETPGTNNPNDLEDCDDANDDDSDPCTKECRWNVCGDGFLYSKTYSENEDEYDSDEDGNPEDDNTAPTEECDDGNTEAGDGCDEDCGLEPAF